MLIMSMISDRIEQQEGLLPINQNYDEIWERNKTLLIRFQKNQKQQFTRRNARQQRAHMTRSVPSYRHDVVTVPLTVLLHCPITSMTRILSCCAQIGRLVRMENLVTVSIKKHNKDLRRESTNSQGQNVLIETAPSQIYSG